MSGPPGLKIRFQEPEMPPLAAVEQYFRGAERAGWFANAGPCHRLLARRIATEVLGTHVTLTSSGTSALAVALHAVAPPRSCIRQGRHRVAIPSFTFAAIPSVVMWAGYEPVFVDIEPDSWHMSSAHLEETLRLLDSDTFAAIITNSTFGVAPSAEISLSWEAISERSGVPLVVDSAAGFGSERRDGSALGRQGLIETFSFHATKPFAIGEGGLVSTSCVDLHESCERAINFGFDGERRVTGDIGTNAKMSEIHAAFGLSVLDRFPEILRRRRTSALAARSSLHSANWGLQKANDLSSWQFVPTTAPTPAVRDAAIRRCTAAGIEVRNYFEPLHTFPGLSEFSRPAGLVETERISRLSLSLPLSNSMEPELASWVAGVATGAVTPRAA